MKNVIDKQFGLLKTTAVGGLIFLLPLIVIGALIGQVIPVVMSVAEVIGEWLPMRTAAGISLLVCIAILLILLLCFLAGMVARWSFGRRFSLFVEKNVLMLFPRYAIIRDQMAGSIGGDSQQPRMKPVLVRLDEMQRIGFEVERTLQGAMVTVYLPGSPDPWSGYVAFIEAARVESLQISFSDAVAVCEQLGRHSELLLSNRNRPSDGAG